MIKSTEFKTSEEWCKLCNFKIMDPDGWERKNFNFSWYEEKITKKEFERRLIESTVQMDFTKGIWK